MKSVGMSTAAGSSLLLVLIISAPSQEPQLAGEQAEPQNTQKNQAAEQKQDDQVRQKGVQTRETRKPARSTQAGNAAAKDQSAMKPTKAAAMLFPIGDSGVTGLITVEIDGQRVLISGVVRGLEPNSKHGFHIHEFGDLSDLKQGQSVGGHFNPDGSKHGRPEDESHARHVGDLGNIEANDDGIAEIRIEDDLVSMHGPRSVIGRAFVVHEGEDKFTQPSGDAGSRLAFGTIGIAKAR